MQEKSYYSFTYLLNQFLTNYCKEQRNLSKNTIHSYASTFKFLIKYCVEKKNLKINEIDFTILDNTLINEFLNFVEEKNSINTRNQRLACIKSFYQYVMSEVPSQLFNGQKILMIKSKKFNKTTIEYISQEGMTLLFNQPDIKTQKGRNDLVILTTLYDTASRISEFLNIKLKDINLGDIPYIIVKGKGRKNRVVTIRKDIKNNLELYIKENNIVDTEQYLFNHKGKQYSNQGITDKINKYVNLAKKEKDIYPLKCTPHIFRHSKAMHLLQNGASLEEIQDYLGHESLETTRIYAKYNVKQQSEILEKCSPSIKSGVMSKWENDENILEILNNL